MIGSNQRLRWRLASLAARMRIDEMMDRADLPVEQLEAALSAIARLNAWSFTPRHFQRLVAQLTRHDARPRLRLLELACGDGNLSIALAQWAQRVGIDFQAMACDITATAVRCAQSNAAARGLRSVAFVQADALCDELGGPYDVGVCSLFLHHLNNEQAIALLRRLDALCTRAVFVDDLSRSATGFWLARAASRILTASPVVRFDAPASVRSAWTPNEALSLAHQAGCIEPRVVQRIPCRYTLIWSPRGPDAPG